MNRISQSRRMKFKLPPVVVSLVVTVAVAVLSAPVFAAPPAPTWLPGQPLLAGNQVIAMWLPVPGAVKYVVYLDGKKIAESPANQYMGIAPSVGGSFSYKVSAVDAAGAEGPKSVPGVIRIVVVNPPTGLVYRTNADDRSAFIRWDAAAGAVFYNVYRSKKKDEGYQLVDSVQNDTMYKDSGLKMDVNYYYRISSKDMTGKESAKSQPLLVKIKAPLVKVRAKANTMVVVPSRELRRVRRVAGMPVPTIVQMSPDPAGMVLIKPLDGAVLREYDPIANELVRKIDLNMVFPEGEKGKYNRILDLQWLDDDNIVVTNMGEPMISVLDVSGEKPELVWKADPARPPKDRKDIWDDIRPDFDRIMQRPGKIYIRDTDTLWVAEAMTDMVYIIDAGNGDTLDWFTRYTFPGTPGKFVKTGGTGQFFPVSDGLVWVAQPILHRIIAVKPESREIAYTMGIGVKGYIGGFLGLNGITSIPNQENAFLVADGGVGSLQVFSGADGKYLYHIGGEKAVVDPGNSGKPKMNIGNCNSPFFDSAGNLWVLDGFGKIISVRQVNWDQKEVMK
ncbi:MAG: hypothetical protein GXP52_01965 [Deltaproteobacteria bacterium]|nr:hypothetical protein [Deltaproteobacteria bacterium]